MLLALLASAPRALAADVTGTMSDSEGKPRPITKGSLDGDKISLFSSCRRAKTTNQKANSQGFC